MTRIWPSMEVESGMAICQARSLVLAEWRELPRDVKNARKYGGAVRRRDMMLL